MKCRSNQDTPWFRHFDVFVRIEWKILSIFRLHLDRAVQSTKLRFENVNNSATCKQMLFVTSPRLIWNVTFCNAWWLPYVFDKLSTLSTYVGVHKSYLSSDLFRSNESLIIVCSSLLCVKQSKACQYNIAATNRGSTYAVNLPRFFGFVDNFRDPLLNTSRFDEIV